MLLLAASVVVAQTCVFETSAAPFTSFPANNATGVPLNARVMVPSSIAFDGALTLLTDDGGVPSQVNPIPIANNFGETVFHLLPGRELAPNTAHRIEGSAGVIAVFITGDDVDEAAPAAPEVTLGQLIAPSESCGPGSAGFFADREDGTAAVAAVDVDPSFEGPLAHVSVVDAFKVFRDDDFTLHVAAMDAAGNLSDPVTVDVDLPEGGCQGCGAALVLPLLPLRRRRRR